jgi:hypothetical protein
MYRLISGGNAGSLFLYLTASLIVTSQELPKVFRILGYCADKEIAESIVQTLCRRI